MMANQASFRKNEEYVYKNIKDKKKEEKSTLQIGAMNYSQKLKLFMIKFQVIG